jgi:hypothetical protein
VSGSDATVLEIAVKTIRYATTLATILGNLKGMAKSSLIDIY